METKHLATTIDTKEVTSVFEQVTDINGCSQTTLKLKSLLIPYEKLDETPAFLYVLDQEQRYPIFSPGNISAIIGKPKSKKTFLTVMAIAATLKNAPLFDKLEGQLPEASKKIVLFDTEQSLAHAQRSLHRICKLVGVDKPDNLLPISLRRFSTAERLTNLKFVLETVQDIGLVIIDGIKDLVQDINSTMEATEIIDYLMKVSAERSLHICVVIHQNKGDNHARGHLGSEVQNKSETVISVKRENDNTSTVNVEYCRSEDFPSFSFAIDSEGLPYLMDSPSKNTKKQSVHQLGDEILLQMLQEIFNKQEEYSYSALENQVKIVFREHDYSVGDSNAGKLVSKFREQGWIKNFSNSGRSSQYRIMV